MSKYNGIIINGWELKAVVFLYAYINIIPNVKSDFEDEDYWYISFSWLFFKLEFIGKKK